MQGMQVQFLDWELKSPHAAQHSQFKNIFKRWLFRHKDQKMGCHFVGLFAWVFFQEGLPLSFPPLSLLQLVY